MNNSKSKVAFLVVCWNNREIIGECLDSLMEQVHVDADIYVIDNNSGDGSSAFIAKQYPKVKLFPSSRNNGFARGNNILIKEALRDPAVQYIALINSDAVLDKEWAHEIVTYLQHKTRVACAQGITLDYYNHDIVDAEHVYVGCNFQSIQYGYGERYRQAYASPRKVFGVNAAAALYNRTFIEEQPQKVLFDERFFMYLEDVDVSFRATITGWSSYYVPSAKAYHMGSVSAKRRSSAYNIYMTFRNQAALMVKNMPVRTFFVCLPGALRFELHFYEHLYRTQGAKVAMLALKGRFVGLLRIPLYLTDRFKLALRRKIDPRQLETLMRNRGIY